MVSEEKRPLARSKHNLSWFWKKRKIQPHSGSGKNTSLYCLPRCWKYFHTTVGNVKYHFISKCFKFGSNSTRGYQKERLACCSSLLKKSLFPLEKEIHHGVRGKKNVWREYNLLLCLAVWENVPEKGMISIFFTGPCRQKPKRVNTLVFAYAQECFLKKGEKAKKKKKKKGKPTKQTKKEREEREKPFPSNSISSFF